MVEPLEDQLKQLWTKEVEEPEVKNSYQYVFQLRDKLEDTFKLAHSELEKAQQKGKHYYDRKSKVRKFQPGERVLVLLPTDHNKLLTQWKGPFEVSSVVGLSDYNVKVIGKEKVYHSSLRKNVFWARGDYSRRRSSCWSRHYKCMYERCCRLCC